MANGNGRVANAALSASTWTNLYQIAAGYKGAYTVNLTNTGNSNVSIQLAISNNGAGTPAAADIIDTFYLTTSGASNTNTAQMGGVVISDQQIIFVNPNATGVVATVWGFASTPN